MVEYSDEFVWAQKYRPRKIDDVILPAPLKETFKKFLEKGELPNLMLSGGPGVGKTTVARALLEELSADYIIINSSLEGNMDTLRNQIMNFASTVSFKGGRKYVILDEADYLTSAVQPALRNFIETFSSNCGFILTANIPGRIMDALHSRWTEIEFKIAKKDAPELAGLFMKRVFDILDQENVKYDKTAVVTVIQKYFPDWRRVLNELQRYAASGEINAGSITNTGDFSIDDLMKLIKAKKFTELRKWVGENLDADSAVLFRRLYDNSNKYLEPSSVPQLILIINDHQYKAQFAVDQEINIMGCLIEIMANCVFK